MLSLQAPDHAKTASQWSVQLQRIENKAFEADLNPCLLIALSPSARVMFANGVLTLQKDDAYFLSTEHHRTARSPDAQASSDASVPPSPSVQWAAVTRHVKIDVQGEVLCLTTGQGTWTDIALALRRFGLTAFVWVPGLWSQCTTFSAELQRIWRQALLMEARESHLFVSHNTLQVRLSLEQFKVLSGPLRQAMTQAERCPGRTLGKRMQTLVRLRKVLCYMDRQAWRGLDIAELAQVASYSPSHFVRVFQQVFGMAPHQWMLQRKMLHAREALEQRVLGVSEVAALVGFEDRSAFSRMFKRMQGETAFQVRRTAIERFALG
jgi:AraC-like DNA-binding protein